LPSARSPRSWRICCPRPETDRVYADNGHSLDFINKSFECLELIGWQHVADLVPTIVGQMVAARGADESTEWRQPVDLVALCARKRPPVCRSLLQRVVIAARG
jgi:hypothetical protein